MKVLLRDNGTGAYFGGGSGWMTDPSAAAEFATVEAAGERARGCGREDVVVVLRYQEPECELALNPAFCVRREVRGGRRLHV